MHYYKRHIGDYAKKTGRLTMLEHGAYTLLIDACYDRERFPTRDEAIEWAWARTPQEIEAVDFVLSRFFDLVDGLYVQKRIQEEVDGYHGNSATNKRIAIEREEKRRQRARSVNEASPDVHEPPPNHKPLTKNHEPVTKEKRSQPLATPDGVSSSVWSDFLAVRKAPMTQAALDGIQREAEKAGWGLEDALKKCCTRGWQSFKADWVVAKPQTFAQVAADVARITVPARQGRDPVLEKIEQDALAAVKPSPEILARMAALRKT